MVQFEPGQRPGGDEQEEEEMENDTNNPRKEPLTYKGAVKKYYLHFHDLDLVRNSNFCAIIVSFHHHHHHQAVFFMTQLCTKSDFESADLLHKPFSFTRALHQTEY